ncbi:MAG: pyridoxamine 5'-phosphate oxidase family protein [Halobacteriaceae archaeon]
MTEDVYGVEMSPAEMAAFLERHGHGVLSFGGDPPYALPMSFGYHVLNDRCVFQFLFNPESRKRDYVTTGDRVTLTAYEWTDPADWRSVVVEGRLSPIEGDSPAALDAASVFAPYETTVSLTVFERPVDELDPAWYELAVEEMHGRQSPTAETP